jgi:hypothetical protein
MRTFTSETLNSNWNLWGGGASTMRGSLLVFIQEWTDGRVAESFETLTSLELLEYVNGKQG